MYTSAILSFSFQAATRIHHLQRIVPCVLVLMVCSLSIIALHVQTHIYVNNKSTTRMRAVDASNRRKKSNKYVRISTSNRMRKKASDEGRSNGTLSRPHIDYIVRKENLNQAAQQEERERERKSNLNYRQNGRPSDRQRKRRRKKKRWYIYICLQLQQEENEKKSGGKMLYLYYRHRASKSFLINAVVLLLKRARCAYCQHH